jgi:hypothetical protein
LRKNFALGKQIEMDEFILHIAQKRKELKRENEYMTVNHAGSQNACISASFAISSLSTKLYIFQELCCCPVGKS